MTRRPVEIVHPCDLAEPDRAAWDRLQAATPALGSPLLGQGFARAVGDVRRDARVAIWRSADGAARAFLAFHHRPGDFGRPIGAPFCDYHGMVCDDGVNLTASQILAASGLKAFRHSGLIDPLGLFHTGPAGEASLAREAAYRIVLRPDARTVSPVDAGLAYLEALKAGSANRYKNFRRYSKRLEQTFGPLRLIEQDPDPQAFERLLAWKRRQLVRTGLHDFLRPPWVAALMHRLFRITAASTAVGDQPSGAFDGASARAFSGLMISLYAGDHHVAGHFGVRLGGWYHPWIGATAPDLEAYGAGFVHQWKAVEAMGPLGLHTYDLGPGSDHWKRLFTSEATEVTKGLITAPTLGGRLAWAGDRIWTAPPLDRLALTRRLRNRLEQIATLETEWSDRARSVVALASAIERRTASRRTDPGDGVVEAAGARPRSIGASL